MGLIRNVVKTKVLHCYPLILATISVHLKREGWGWEWLHPFLTSCMREVQPLWGQKWQWDHTASAGWWEHDSSLRGSLLFPWLYRSTTFLLCVKGCKDAEINLKAAALGFLFKYQKISMRQHRVLFQGHKNLSVYRKGKASLGWLLCSVFFPEQFLISSCDQYTLPSWLVLTFSSTQGYSEAWECIFEP